jgi:hypothetical protein
VTADPTLGIGAYLVGVLWILAVGAPLGVLAASVARRALPPGAVRAVAALVAALLHLTITGQVLGAVGLLRAWPFAAAIWASAAVGGVVLRRSHPAGPPDRRAGRPGRSGRVDLLVGVGAVAVVSAQWLSHTVDALQRGMTHADTLWYHGPFSARFLQMGSLGDLGPIGYLEARYYPLGSELLHTIVALPFHRDLLSPLVNLVFFGLALGACWAIGERFGVGALGLIGGSAGLSLPTLAGTQPGQASNDVAVIALFLAATAIVLHAGSGALPLALAGAALGLAVGTKVTIVAMAAFFVLVVGASLVRAGDRRSAGALVLGAAVPAVAWPLRNLVVAGNPLPFWRLSIGPIELDAVAPPSGNPSVLRDLLSGTEWSYVDGLRNGLGPLWPAVLLTVAGGSLAVALRGPRPLRPAALTALLGAAAYVVTPVTGGSSFQFNLRYLAPALVTGLVVSAVGAAHTGRARLAVVPVLVLVLLAGITAEHHERVPTWPGSGGQTVVVVLSVLAVIGVAALVRRSRGLAAPVAAAVVVTVLVGGWFVQEHHLEHRYVDAGLHDDELNAFFRTVRGAPVDLLGSPESYPLFGADLSNDVRDWSLEMYLGTPQPADPCTFWRTALDGPGWVAVSSFGYVMAHLDETERAAILGADPAASVRLDGGDHSVYWLDAGLDPTGCSGGAGR